MTCLEALIWRLRQNTTVELTAAASALIGAAVSGKLELGDEGFVFHYGKQNGGSSLFFAWSEIDKLELSISFRGRLKKFLPCLYGGTFFGLRVTKSAQF